MPKNENQQSTPNPIAESVLFLLFFFIQIQVIELFPATESSLKALPAYLGLGLHILLPSVAMAMLFRKPSFWMNFARFYISAATFIAVFWVFSVLFDKKIGDLMYMLFMVGITVIWNATEGIGKILSLIGIFFYIGIVLVAMSTIVSWIFVVVNGYVFTTIARFFPHEKQS